MKCANCGNEIQAADTFCPHCGERLNGFTLQTESSGSVDPADDNLTCIGHFDETDKEDLTYGRTYMDSSLNDYPGNIPEDKTFLDTSGIPGNSWNPHMDNYRKGSERPASEYSSIKEDPEFSGSELGNPSWSKDPFRQPGYRYTDSVTNGTPSVPAAEAAKPFSHVALIVAIVLVLFAVAGGAFFFFWNRTPEIDDLTYDELVAEYDLSSDSSDDVKNAFYENTRFEFDEIIKSSSGYRATALIYTPDLEEIYQQTVVPDEVIGKLNRLSDNDLDYQKKTVMLNKSQDGLSESAAKTLQAMVNQKYLAPEEYRTGVQSPASSSQAASSGNTQTESAANSAQNAPAGQESQSGSAELPDSPSQSVRAPVTITGASATSTLYEKGYDHSPSNVLDGKLSTAWVEGASGQGTGERLTLTFGGEHTISSMIIHAGYQKNARLYGRNSRPKTMTLFFSDGSNESVALSDTNGVQTLYLVNPVTTSSVTIQIDSVYAGSVYQDTCISEVRFQ